MALNFVTEDPVAFEAPSGSVILETGGDAKPLCFRTRGHYLNWLLKQVMATTERAVAMVQDTDSLFSAPYLTEQQEAEARAEDFHEQGRAS